MPKFRKKPVVIEAYQLSAENQDEIVAWINEFNFAVGSWHDGLSIETLEGMMKAKHGDWVIKGVYGEFYSVKPEIFKATYDPDEDCACCEAGHGISSFMPKVYCQLCDHPYLDAEGNRILVPNGFEVVDNAQGRHEAIRPDKS